MSFRSKNTLETRKRESSRIRTKHPNRIPVIVERGEGCKLPLISATRYLVPEDFPVSSFMGTIRGKIQLKPEEAIFLYFGGNNLVAQTQLMSQVYQAYKNEDGFLYVTYMNESTFGNCN